MYAQSTVKSKLEVSYPPPHTFVGSALLPFKLCIRRYYCVVAMLIWNYLAYYKSTKRCQVLENIRALTQQVLHLWLFYRGRGVESFSGSIYYTEWKLKNKNWGNLGTRLVSMYTTICFSSSVSWTEIGCTCYPARASIKSYCMKTTLYFYHAPFKSECHVFVFFLFRYFLFSVSAFNIMWE